MDVKKSEISNEMGSIRIADEVVSTVAGIAAGEAEGIFNMSGKWGADIVEKFGKKNFSKGIKVEVNEDQTNIDIFVVIKYGYTIPEVAENVQNSVRSAVETMTGLKVAAVNVHVVSVAIVKPETDDVVDADFVVS